MYPLLCHPHHRCLLHFKVWERHPEAAKEVIRQPPGVVAMRIARGSREGLPIVVKRKCRVLQYTHTVSTLASEEVGLDRP